MAQVLPLLTDTIIMKLCRVGLLSETCRKLVVSYWDLSEIVCAVPFQEPLNAPFLNGLFSNRFSSGKRPNKAFGETAH